MSLPDTYLTYANRKHGQDIDRYAMRYAGDRKKTLLPNGEALAVSIIVPLEFFMLNPSGKPFKHPGAMATPYPDLRHFTTRDYGNRVGAFRLLKAFKAAGAKVTFAVNAALLTRVKPLIDAIIADGHEIAAHGWDTDSIHWGEIDPALEKNYVAETRAAFDKVGLKPRAWMSPARQQSFHTPDLIREAGFDICLDWEADTVPLAMNTRHGELNALPVSNELDDRFILQTKHHDEAAWRDQILEAAAMMKSEAPTHGAQTLSFAMTPYVAAQPFRIWAMKEILTTLGQDKDILLATATQTVESFK